MKKQIEELTSQANPESEKIMAQLSQFYDIEKLLKATENESKVSEM